MISLHASNPTSHSSTMCILTLVQGTSMLDILEVSEEQLGSSGVSVRKDCYNNVSADTWGDYLKFKGIHQVHENFVIMYVRKDTMIDMYQIQCKGARYEYQVQFTNKGLEYLFYKTDHPHYPNIAVARGARYQLDTPAKRGVLPW